MIISLSETSTELVQAAFDGAFIGKYMNFLAPRQSVLCCGFLVPTEQFSVDLSIMKGCKKKEFYMHTCPHEYSNMLDDCTLYKMSGTTVVCLQSLGSTSNLQVLLFLGLS